MGERVGEEASPPVPSPDGEAALLNVPLETDLSPDENADVIESSRADAAQAGLPEGLEVQVTGGPAFRADVASSFDGR